MLMGLVSTGGMYHDEWAQGKVSVSRAGSRTRAPLRAERYQRRSLSRVTALLQNTEPWHQCITTSGHRGRVWA